MIQIGASRGGDHRHPVNVLASPAGEGSSELRLPQGLDRCVAALRVSGGQVRGAGERHVIAEDGDLDPTGTLAVRNVGDQLFRALFTGQVRSLYDHSLGIIGSRPGHGLRIKLKLDAKDRDLAHLASLPWEFLWRTETQDFLSLSRLSPVVRYLDVPRPASPIQVGATLRVLVVVSSPKGLDSLNLKKEMTQLQEACRRWKGVEVTFLEDADVSSLRQKLLEKRFHVLHFMGHGGFDETTGEGVLYFTKPDKALEALSGEALSTLLKDSKSLGLVLLNACETARLQAEGTNPFSGVANALVLGGLAAVIAMQFPISDEAAIAFSSAFYQQLAAGDAIDTAVVEGRRAVLSAASQTLEWGTPVLFLRVPDAHVFQKRGRSKQDDEEPYSTWSLGRLALLLALVFAVTAAGYFIIREWKGPIPEVQHQIASTKGYSFDLDHAFTSTQDGLVGAVTRVELAGNGRMRMYFRFRNKSQKDQGLGFNYRSTYLADQAGNRYAVLGADAPAKAGETAVDHLLPGQEIERWMEFPAPRDQARSFQVGLEGTEGGARFPLFPVDLPAYPTTLSIATPAVQIDPKSKVLPVSQPFTTNVDGFQGSLKGVELRDNTRMRWSFAFLNKSARDQTVSFEYDNIYLQDEFGNRYKVVTSDTGGGPGRYYQESLQRAVRADHWFEFEAPVNGARHFTVVLASHDRRSLAFNPFKIRMPYYPPSYSRVSKPAPLPAQKTPAPQETPRPQEAQVAATPVPADTPPPEPPREEIHPDRALAIQKADNQWGTSIKGLSGRLLAIESLPDGRVRWTFEFINQTGSALEFGLNLKASYLADDLGHRYSIARADTGIDHPIYQQTLQNGRSASHWIEFPGPANGAHKFLAVLTSHSPNVLRFLPFQAELPRKGAKPK